MWGLLMWDGSQFDHTMGQLTLGSLTMCPLILGPLTLGPLTVGPFTMGLITVVTLTFGPLTVRPLTKRPLIYGILTLALLTVWLTTLEVLSHCFLLYYPGLYLEFSKLNQSPDYPTVLVVGGSSIFISCVCTSVLMFVTLYNILQPPYMGMKEKEGKERIWWTLGLLPIACYNI